MTEDIRAAAYLVVVAIEECANKAGRKSESITEMYKLRNFKGIRDIDSLRILRNLLVHHPFSYAEIYRTINKYRRSLEAGLVVCAEYAGVSGTTVALETLFVFYKENK